MNTLEATVTKVLIEPYEKYSMWIVDVEYNCYGVTNETKVMVDTQEQLAFIKLIEMCKNDIKQGKVMPISEIEEQIQKRKEEHMKKIDLSKVKVGDKLVAKMDGGMNGDMYDLFCKKGKSYSITAVNNRKKHIAFIDENRSHHTWDDLAGNIDEYFYLQPKNTKQKGKSENWTNTISESKFNRCIKDCIVIQKDYHSTQGFDIYYNEKTNTIYRRLQCADGMVRCVSKHLNRCPDQKVVEIYDEMLLATYYSKGVIVDQFQEDLSGHTKNMMQYEVSVDVDNIPEKTPVKSDGGDSKYYHIPVPQWFLDNITQRGYTTVEDIAEIAFKNEANFFNVFKAQCRMFDLTQGGGKEGNTFEYDANKCKYYVDKQVEVFNRGE